MKLIVRLFFLHLFLPVSYCLAENTAFPNVLGSKTLNETNSLHTLTRIPISIIEFKEATTANATSGFFAENEISIEGDVHTKLIDFPASTSTKNIYENFVRKLTSSGFDVLYQCIGKKCGEKDGFRLYFSTRLNDADISQHYIVASRGNMYSAFYVAQIDEQPRGYLFEATTHNITGIALSNNLIPFDIGSALLSNSSKSIIDKWLSTIPNTTKVISVLGHADSSGSLEKNIPLAEARAKAVNEYVAGKLKNTTIPKIFSLSAANLARPLNGSRGRYVELMAHLSE